MSVTQDIVNALRAESHQHEPIVLAYGIDSYNQCTMEEKEFALRASGGGDTTPKVICLIGNNDGKV